MPTNAHSPSSSAQSGVPYFRKEVEVPDSGSRHHPCGKREHFQSRVVPEKSRQMAAAPGFKSQRQSSSAAPFLAPPTIGHSCQHSGQVWPSGVEPMISKLFWAPLQIPIWVPPLGCTLLHYLFILVWSYRKVFSGCFMERANAVSIP